VRVQSPAVVEHNQLMLSAAFDRAHRRAAQRSKSWLRYATAKRRMKHIDARDRLADHGTPQPTNGAFDFR
jgi:hypothetical protein